MRPVPPELTARIASGAATLCRCWRLQRLDGEILGFTDHDRALKMGGLVYEPESGFSASAISTELGLSVGGAEAQGALSSDRIRGEDIDAGLYDEASVQLWLVDWREPEVRHLLGGGEIGEIQRGRDHFVAEMRSVTHKLNVPIGRVYQRHCDAVLGDARCKVDLTRGAFRGVGMIAEVRSNTSFRVSGLDDYAPEWFGRGVLTWTSGPNEGAPGTLKSDLTAAVQRWFELWTPPPRDLAVGQAFVVTAGCDKRWETCRDRFSNRLNFRGFRNVPGDDAANSYPNNGDNLDGGRLDV